MTNPHRIAALEFDGKRVQLRSPEVEHEREVAIRDLLESNHFQPLQSDIDGPYRVLLRIVENRLHLDITPESTIDITPVNVTIPILPFKRIIKDYFLICEEYFSAIRSASARRIEALDMGRRGVHNEGSEILQDMLDNKVKTDFDTARRLFTLICVLHVK